MLIGNRIRRGEANLEETRRQLEEILRSPLSSGSSLVRDGGRGADGIAATMEHLRSRAGNVEALVGMRREVRGGGEALKSFVAKLAELEEWSSATVDTFMEQNRTLHPPGPFLEAHREFANRIHMKTFELEGLRGALEAMEDRASEEEMRSVGARMEGTKMRLAQLLARINGRISAGEAMEKLLRLCEQLDMELTSLEKGLQRKEERSSLEETWMLVKHLHAQLKEQSRWAREATAKADGGRLRESDGASAEETLTRLGSRLEAAEKGLKAAEAAAREGRRMEEEWGRIDREKRESLEVTLRVDAELFPIIGDPLSSSVSATCTRLEERALALPRQRLVQERFVQLISRIEDLLAARKLPTEKEDEARKMVNDLRQKLKALQVNCASFITHTEATVIYHVHSYVCIAPLQLLFNEYELILQMLIPFFKNFGELDQTMKNLIQQYKQGRVPNTVVSHGIMFSCVCLNKTVSFIPNRIGFKTSILSDRGRAVGSRARGRALLPPGGPPFRRTGEGRHCGQDRRAQVEAAAA